jgi:hypothetical protein
MLEAFLERPFFLNRHRRAPLLKVRELFLSQPEAGEGCKGEKMSCSRLTAGPQENERQSGVAS